MKPSFLFGHLWARRPSAFLHGDASTALGARGAPESGHAGAVSKPAGEPGAQRALSPGPLSPRGDPGPAHVHRGFSVPSGSGTSARSRQGKKKPWKGHPVLEDADPDGRPPLLARGAGRTRPGRAVAPPWREADSMAWGPGFWRTATRAVGRRRCVPRHAAI